MDINKNQTNQLLINNIKDSATNSSKQNNHLSVSRNERSYSDIQNQANRQQDRASKTSGKILPNSAKSPSNNGDVQAGSNQKTNTVNRISGQKEQSALKSDMITDHQNDGQSEAELKSGIESSNSTSAQSEIESKVEPNAVSYVEEQEDSVAYETLNELPAQYAKDIHPAPIIEQFDDASVYAQSLSTNTTSQEISVHDSKHDDALMSNALNSDAVSELAIETSEAQSDYIENNVSVELLPSSIQTNTLVKSDIAFGRISAAVINNPQQLSKLVSQTMSDKVIEFSNATNPELIQSQSTVDSVQANKLSDEFIIENLILNQDKLSKKFSDKQLLDSMQLSAQLTSVVERNYSQGVPGETIKPLDAQLNQPIHFQLNGTQQPVASSGAEIISKSIEPKLYTADESAKIGQLSEKIMMMINKNENSAKINIDPPDLGGLEIKISHAEGKTNILFTATTVHGKDAIESQLQDLRQQFTQHGLDLGDVNVFQQNSEHPSNSESQQQLYSNQLTHQDESSANVHVTLVKNGLIDYYV